MAVSLPVTVLTLAQVSHMAFEVCMCVPQVNLSESYPPRHGEARDEKSVSGGGAILAAKGSTVDLCQLTSA
jgi:hypothetical protein